MVARVGGVRGGRAGGLCGPAGAGAGGGGRGFSAAYPAHFGARVTVETDRGRWSETVADAWGDSENPMAAADVVAKFRRLADWGGVADAGALERAVLALPGGGPMADVVAAMRGIAAEMEKA